MNFEKIIECNKNVWINLDKIDKLECYKPQLFHLSDQNFNLSFQKDGQVLFYIDNFKDLSECETFKKKIKLF